MEPGALGSDAPMRASAVVRWDLIDFPDSVKVRVEPGMTLHCEARPGRFSVELIAPEGLRRMPEPTACRMAFGVVEVLFVARPKPHRSDDGSLHVAFDGPGCETLALETPARRQRQKGKVGGVTCEVDEAGSTLTVCALPRRWAPASDACALRTADGKLPIMVEMVEPGHWAVEEPPRRRLTHEALERDPDAP